MKKLLGISLLAMTLSVVVVGCSGETKAGETKEGTEKTPAAQATWKYTCPMKCEGGHANEPGSCAGCGMPLVLTSELEKGGAEVPK